MKNHLRMLRAERRWSQADLAERLGVSRQTVNAIETQKYDPSLPLAFRIAALFERRIEDLFESAEPALDEPSSGSERAVRADGAPRPSREPNAAEG